MLVAGGFRLLVLGSDVAFRWCCLLLYESGDVAYACALRRHSGGGAVKLNLDHFFRSIREPPSAHLAAQPIITVFRRGNAVMRCSGDLLALLVWRRNGLCMLWRIRRGRSLYLLLIHWPQYVQ